MHITKVEAHHIKGFFPDWLQIHEMMETCISNFSVLSTSEYHKAKPIQVHNVTGMVLVHHNLQGAHYTGSWPRLVKIKSGGNFAFAFERITLQPLDIGVGTWTEKLNSVKPAQAL